MRIDGNSPPYVVDIRKVQELRQQSAASGQQSPPVAKVQSPDRVVISPQAREISRLKQEMAALPDVRLDRVALAKQQMQYDSYRVDPSVLAQKMMESTRRG